MKDHAEKISLPGLIKMPHQTQRPKATHPRTARPQVTSRRLNLPPPQQPGNLTGKRDGPGGDNGLSRLSKRVKRVGDRVVNGK